jgi:hypothetical protein
MYVTAGLTAFYRYWKPSVNDHLYTTNIFEFGTATPGQLGHHGYVSEGIECLIYSRQVRGTVPLHRYWRPRVTSNDHFYTIDPDEVGTTTLNGYISEGVAGYCFPRAIAGAVPLYRYWKFSVRDHFYTTNAAEIGTTTPGVVGNHGYRSEGVACHVIPYNG